MHFQLATIVYKCGLCININLITTCSIEFIPVVRSKGTTPYIVSPSGTLILCAWEYDAPPDAETVPMVVNMTNIEIPSLTTIFAFILSDSLLFTLFQRQSYAYMV